MSRLPPHARRRPAGSGRGSPRRRRAGFSLVELMVAIALFGIVIAATFGLLTSNLGLRRSSTRSGAALQLASSHLEAFKRTWNRMDAYQPVPVIPAPPTVEQDPRVDDYDWTVDIECLQLDGTTIDCASNPNPVLRRVIVTLTDSRTGAVAARMATEIGRPFDPAGS